MNRWRAPLSAQLHVPWCARRGAEVTSRALGVEQLQLQLMRWHSQRCRTEAETRGWGWGIIITDEERRGSDGLFSTTCVFLTAGPIHSSLMFIHYGLMKFTWMLRRATRTVHSLVHEKVSFLQLNLKDKLTEHLDSVNIQCKKMTFPASFLIPKHTIAIRNNLFARNMPTVAYPEPMGLTYLF